MPVPERAAYAGFVSEHLATKRYGPEREFFGNLEGLTGAQSLCCFVWAWGILQVLRLSGSIKAEDTAGWTDYYVAGITNSLGPSLGMVALKNITYSAQVRARLYTHADAPDPRNAGHIIACETGCVAQPHTAHDGTLGIPSCTHTHACTPDSTGIQPSVCLLLRVSPCRCWSSHVRWCQSC